MQTDVAMSPRMGRPSMGVKATAVRLAPEIMERIDGVAGKNRRAEFIRAAIVEKLEREQS